MENVLNKYVQIVIQHDSFMGMAGSFVGMFRCLF